MQRLLLEKGCYQDISPLKWKAVLSASIVPQVPWYYLVSCPNIDNRTYSCPTFKILPASLSMPNTSSSSKRRLFLRLPQMMLGNISNLVMLKIPLPSWPTTWAVGDGKRIPRHLNKGTTLLDSYSSWLPTWPHISNPNVMSRWQWSLWT